MRRNAIFPYILIMVMGIFLVAGLSLIALGQKNLADADDATETEQGEEAVVLAPEDIYQQNCMSCHGGNYEGGFGPPLTGLGDHMAEDEVREVLTSGRGAMPGGLVPEDSMDDMVNWLMSLE